MCRGVHSLARESERFGCAAVTVQRAAVPRERRRIARSAARRLRMPPVRTLQCAGSDRVSGLIQPGPRTFIRCRQAGRPASIPAGTRMLRHGNRGTGAGRAGIAHTCPAFGTTSPRNRQGNGFGGGDAGQPNCRPRTMPGASCAASRQRHAVCGGSAFHPRNRAPPYQAVAATVSLSSSIMRSRMTNFWTLPVTVIGISVTKRM